MAEDWSDIENELIIGDYFSMLRDQIAGTPYNKTEHRKRLSPLLRNRSDGSIEFKHQNISAVLSSFGIPWINGYKPRWNYQKKSLEEKVTRYLRNNSSLEKDFTLFAETPTIEVEPGKINFRELIEPRPKSKVISEPSESYFIPTNRNYLEIEQNNKRLGNCGEETVVKYEKWRLLEAGKNSLADSVEWVAKTQGDGLGYDILSKNVNGTDRCIEVKTTKLGKDAPIFFSKKEYDFSTENEKKFYLFRLFNFNTEPKAFVLNGKFEDFCKFHAVKFQGSF